MRENEQGKTDDKKINTIMPCEMRSMVVVALIPVRFTSGSLIVTF